MKIRVKSAWLDKDGIHKKGDVLDVDVKDFDPLRMIALEEPKAEKEGETESPDETKEPKEETKPKTTKKSKK